MNGEQFGNAITRLWATIQQRKNSSVELSYTATLLAGGPAKCAKKFGEEAIEFALAGVAESDQRVAEEAADSIYHLLILLAVRGVSLDDVAAVLSAREGRSGHEEKVARK